MSFSDKWKKQINGLNNKTNENNTDDNIELNYEDKLVLTNTLDSLTDNEIKSILSSFLLPHNESKEDIIYTLVNNLNFNQLSTIIKKYTGLEVTESTLGYAKTMNSTDFKKEDLDYFHNEGFKRFSIGKYEESIEYYNKALNFDDKNADYWKIKGYLYLV